MKFFKIYNKSIKKQNKKNKKKQNKRNLQTRKKLQGGEASPVIKKLNCHPKVHGKTVHNNSCFTPKALLQIKNSYNQSHPNNKIISSQPVKIWDELNNKMKYCQKEDCWLQEVKDEGIKNQLQQQFSPNHPKDWLKNPNEWLSNDDILAVLKQYQETYSYFKFIGPSMIDYDVILPEENNNCVENELCNFNLSNTIRDGKTKIGIIFNLDKHTKTGSHWVSLFIDIKDKLIFYFDSFGNDIPPYINKFKEEVVKQGKQLKKPIHFDFEINKTEHQEGNTECGMYSLFFIVTMLTGEKEIGKKLEFFQSGKIEDKYVEKYRKIYFNSPS